MFTVHESITANLRRCWTFAKTYISISFQFISPTISPPVPYGFFSFIPPLSRRCHVFQKRMPRIKTNRHRDRSDNWELKRNWKKQPAPRIRNERCIFIFTFFSTTCSHRRNGQCTPDRPQPAVVIFFYGSIFPIQEGGNSCNSPFE